MWCSGVNDVVVYACCLYYAMWFMCMVNEVCAICHVSCMLSYLWRYVVMWVVYEVRVMSCVVHVLFWC